MLGVERQRDAAGTDVFDSFNYAFEGIIHVLRTQRNMRIHFAVAVVVIVAALVVNVTKLELIALCISITFVLIAEMLNTGVEAAIDIATTSFDPMAKLAKDIAAGAVLIAPINALIVGYLVFSGKVADRSSQLLDRLRQAPAELTIVALVLTVIIVIATKAYTGRGTPLRGGLPSGHAALAFAGWMAITYIAGADHRFVVSSVALVLALLVAQTRVESGVHSALEVAYGALVGALATLVVFQVFVVSRRAASREGGGGRASRRTRRTRTTSSARSCARATAREFAGMNVENAAYPLTQCAEKTAIGAAATAGLPARATSRRSAISASPCGGCRQWLHEWRMPRVEYRRADGTIAHDERRRAAAGHAGTCPDEVGLRRRRRPAERRQVDARQRADRREGRDRLRKPHTTRHRIRGVLHDRRRAARARRPARLAEADRHADRAHAGRASTRR